MTNLCALVLGGLLGIWQSEPPVAPPPSEEKPPVKQADEKVKPEPPAEGAPSPAKAPGEKPRIPSAPAQARTGDSDRPTLSDSQLKALHENNIFSPRRVKRVAKSSSSSEPVSIPADVQTKPRPPLVTGFIYDAKAACYVVVVEDRNGPSWKLFKEPKFLKEGEEVVGFHINSIRERSVVVTWGESTAELKVGEPFPDIGFHVPEASIPQTPSNPATSAPGPAKAEAPPLDEGTKNKVLEELRGRYKKTRRSSADDP
jgi:hypothetical protein